MALYSNPYLKGRYFPEVMEAVHTPPGSDVPEVSSVNNTFTAPDESKSPESQQKQQHEVLRHSGLTDDMIYRAEETLHSKCLVSSPEKRTGGEAMGKVDTVGRGGDGDNIAQQLIFDVLHGDGRIAVEQEAASETAAMNDGMDIGRNMLTTVEDAYHPKIQAVTRKGGYGEVTLPDSDNDSSTDGDGYGDISKGFAIPMHSMIEHSVFRASSSSTRNVEVQPAPAPPSPAVAVAPPGGATTDPFGAVPQLKEDGYGTTTSQQEQGKSPGNTPGKADISARLAVPHLQEADLRTVLANQDNDFAEAVDQGTEAIIPPSPDQIAAAANNTTAPADGSGSRSHHQNVSPTRSQHLSPSRHSVTSSPNRYGGPPTPSPKRSQVEVHGAPGSPVAAPKVNILTVAGPVPAQPTVVDVGSEEMGTKQPQQLYSTNGRVGPAASGASSRSVGTHPVVVGGDASVQAMIEQSLNAMQQAQRLLSAPRMKSVLVVDDEDIVVVANRRPDEVNQPWHSPTAQVSRPSNHAVFTPPAPSAALITTLDSEPVSRVRKLRRPPSTSSSTAASGRTTSGRSGGGDGSNNNTQGRERRKGGGSQEVCPTTMSSCRRRHLTTALRDQGAATPTIEHVVRGSSLDGGSMDERGGRGGLEGGEETSDEGTTLTPVSSASEGNYAGDYSLADDYSTAAERTPRGVQPALSTKLQEVSTSSSSDEAEAELRRHTSAQQERNECGSSSPTGLPPRSEGSGTPTSLTVQIPKYDFSPVTPQELIEPTLAERKSSSRSAQGFQGGTLGTSGIKSGVGLAHLQQQIQQQGESHQPLQNAWQQEGDHRFPPSNEGRLQATDVAAGRQHPLVAHSSIPVADVQQRPLSPTKVVATAPTPSGLSAVLAQNLMAKGPLQLQPTTGSSGSRAAWNHTTSVKRNQHVDTTSGTTRFSSPPERRKATSPSPSKHRGSSPHGATPRYLLPTSSWEAKGVALRSVGGRRQQSSSSMGTRNSALYDQEARHEDEHRFHHCHHAEEHELHGNGGTLGDSDGRWPYPLAQPHDPHHAVVSEGSPLHHPGAVITVGASRRNQTPKDHFGDDNHHHHHQTPGVDHHQEEDHCHQESPNTERQRGTWGNNMMHVGRYKQDIGTFNRHAESIRQRQLLHDSKHQERPQQQVRFRQVGTARPSNSPRQVVGVSQLARMVQS